jgi:vacuolar-type H+-ATPase subunit H
LGEVIPLQWEDPGMAEPSSSRDAEREARLILDEARRKAREELDAARRKAAQLHDDARRQSGESFAQAREAADAVKAEAEKLATALRTAGVELERQAQALLRDVHLAHRELLGELRLPGVVERTRDPDAPRRPGPEEIFEPPNWLGGDR